MTILPVTIEQEPRSKTMMVTFMVVNLPLVYNVSLGHLVINKSRAVVSTYHRIMKFLTRAGIREWELVGSSSKDRELTRSTSGVRRKMIENLTKSSLEDAGKFTERSEDQLTCWTTRMIVIMS
ncbi:hypothetical protein BHE74_00013130 [Ensete ventricosum]|nr:hypothetical protein BHE74_00013130 [Ensete ventricosum]